jgi:UDP-arabinose 4-epimerase
MTQQAVLVTGGAGYIGSHVCKSLAKKGFIPVTYDNLCSGNAEAVKWGPLEIGDIRDRARLAAVIAAHKPVAIMHFAALIAVGESVHNPAAFYDNNVFGSYCLLEEARKANILNMVFSSTAAVYGAPQQNAITESHPLNPVNPYGATKLAMENMIRDFSDAYGIKHAILRYFNAAGADIDAEAGTAYRNDTHIIPLLMRVASGSMPQIRIFGNDYATHDGTAMRDYIHVADLAEAHVLALKRIMDGNESLTLNLGTSKGHTVQEIIDAVRAVTRRPVQAQTEARREGDPGVLVADASEAQRLLGWSPVHSDIETIVHTAWNWRRKQDAMGTTGAFTGTHNDNTPAAGDQQVA